MPDHEQSIPLDQAPYSERLRRSLYDAVVRNLFSPSPQEDAPTYTPEEAGLAVFWVWGRWFAVWFDLDTEDEMHLPLSRKWQVVRIQTDPAMPDGIQLHEV